MAIPNLPLTILSLTVLATVALSLTIATAGSVAAAAALTPRCTTAVAAATATTSVGLTSAISTSVATSSTVATTAAAAATSSTVRGLVDADGTSVEFNIVHVLHGRVSLGVLGKANEAKATAATRITILDYNSFFDLAEFFELLAQGSIIGMPCEATNKEFGHGVD